MAVAALVGTGTTVAEAATNTPVSAVSVSPSHITAGSTARVSVSATNAGRSGLGQVALGVTTTLVTSAITAPPNAACRSTIVTGRRLVYCLVYSLPAGQTATLGLTVNAPLAGSYTFNAYARNVATMNDTSSAATLTVT
jgi:hypothetical protein